tara:strand:+ start:433 stop:807 length:375 start_codon:yes stop_codon:yes gene_type:complete
MGRYYNGDIEGKFWFAVQSSTDAEFFGVVGSEPSYLDYYFSEDNLKDIEEGISECKKELGDWKSKLDQFFKENDGYNYKMIEEQLGLVESQARDLLEWYARLDLGTKILKCVQKNGECSFTAEL